MPKTWPYIDRARTVALTLGYDKRLSPHTKVFKFITGRSRFTCEKFGPFTTSKRVLHRLYERSGNSRNGEI